MQIESYIIKGFVQYIKDFGIYFKYDRKILKGGDVISFIIFLVVVQGMDQRGRRVEVRQVIVVIQGRDY